MIPSLQWVKLHRDLHGVTNPKHPDGAIDSKRAATQRKRHIRIPEGDVRIIPLPQSTSLQLTCARKEQTNHSQQKENTTQDQKHSY